MAINSSSLSEEIKTLKIFMTQSFKKGEIKKFFRIKKSQFDPNRGSSGFSKLIVNILKRAQLHKALLHELEH